MTSPLDRSLSRLGKEVPVYEKSETTGENQFGQQNTTWNDTGNVLAVMSRQNRNTTMNTTRGERHRDRPIFFFPSDDHPPSNARIKYNGRWYELDSITQFETHVVAPGSVVLDDTFPP